MGKYKNDSQQLALPQDDRDKREPSQTKTTPWKSAIWFEKVALKKWTASQKQIDKFTFVFGSKNKTGLPTFQHSSTLVPQVCTSDVTTRILKKSKMKPKNENVLKAKCE